jgi:XTP/dITP diphosphohydrolase
MHLFEGAIEGTVPSAPVGPRGFQWDCVFVPDGSTQTFAEMGTAKDAISMRRKALDKFADHIKAAKGAKRKVSYWMRIARAS